MLTRRRWMALVGLMAASRRVGAAQDWTVHRVAGAAPMRQVRAGGPSGLLGIDALGTLWALADSGAAPRRLAEGLDSATPVATGHGRLAARTAAGGLCILEDGRARGVRTADIADHAGLLILPLAVIAVVVANDGHRIARFEETQGIWSEVARSVDPVMPDARPLQVALADGDDPDGHLVVLAGPDALRYDHGVLGDRIEATRILWLDRHALTPLRDLRLPAPYVFEDIAPRPVRLDRGTGLLTMRSGGSGTRLALIAVDPVDGRTLRIAALGDALDGPHRWLAPTTDGRSWMAVHTPHVGGVLNAYRLDGERLVRRVVTDDVTNHRIGTREIDLSIWLGPRLVVPNQDRTRLRVFDGTRDWAERESILLQAKVISTVALEDRRRFAVLTEDGAVFVAAPG